MKNQSIANLFRRMGQLLEVKGEIVFKIRAYQKAAENIENLAEDIETLKKEDRLSDIPGIGQALKDKIIEFCDTGNVKAYQELTQEIPESILDVMDIPTVGPKKAKLFYDEFGVKNVPDLVGLIQSGKLKGHAGIKEKTIQNILDGIKIVKAGQERMNLGKATRIADQFVQALKKLKEVKQISTAGSLRRGKETIGDIDILVATADPKKVTDTFIQLPGVKTVQARGDTKASILNEDNVQVDLRIVDENDFGAALLYFTGSKNFNVKIRQIAIDKKMKVNEYGVFQITESKKGQDPVETRIAGKTEKECLAALNLPFIEPELREDMGEAEAFSGKKLPALITLQDIKGDLHMHSTYSDGKNTIAEMAEAAIARGYEYVAISDHSPRLRVAGGVSVEDLKKKKKEIESLNKTYKNFKILFGTEVEIDMNGDLDYNTDTLKEFDIVIAAIHSGFEQDEKTLTQRLLKVIQHKYVHVIAHPTGVHIGKREPYTFDFKKICQAALDYKVYLEINAFPVRLDLNSANVYFARGQGVQFSINTDSHNVEHLDYMKHGISIARRGWLTKKDVINTLSAGELLKVIKK